jgi:arginyl-tRNA synthetase
LAFAVATSDMWRSPTSAPLEITALNDLYVRWREEVNPISALDVPKWLKAVAAGGAAREAMRETVLTELEAASTKASALEEEARAWFKKLEGGDAEARELWQRFRDVSWAEFESVYSMLGIVFEEVRGESAYEPDLPGVMTELRSKGLVVESEGAQVVVLEDEKTPILLQKSDGSTLYATRDFASAQYRWNTHHFTRSIYVVDRGQSLHFRQLFKLLAKAGYDWAARCQHIPFGLVRMGGKKSSTRGGSSILLKDVFREAAARSLLKITESSPEMPVATAVAIAKQVGLGGVLFANLATQRDKDVDFEWEKALAPDGDFGPYLQYCHARCASIMRKSGVAISDLAGIDFTRLGTDVEWAVARRLLEFADAVVRASETCEPHFICHYLLEVAGEFSRWYTAGNGDPSLRVLCEDAPTRAARLALAAAVQQVLATGLSLLGISAPDQM